MKKGQNYQQLNLQERETIERLFRQKYSIRAIAKILGRNPSTISRDLKRYSPYRDSKNYSGKWCHEISQIENRRSRQRNAKKPKALLEFVHSKLEIGWTPEQISGYMSAFHPEWRISHEAIYQYIYKDCSWDVRFMLPRAGMFRLPRPKYRKTKRTIIPNRIGIEQRPESVNQRTEIGHWESDSMVCKQTKCAINVMVERKTRLVKITKLPNMKPASTYEAIVGVLSNLPSQARQSITYDNGIENRYHELINANFNMSSYFCAPYHSWEKGSVENMNGLIRRVYPKKTDWSKKTQEDLDRLESLLNNRPRKCLGYLTPLEAFNRFL